MSEPNELMPCPWCGDEPRVGVAAGLFFVDCVKCKNVRKFGTTRDEAIANWNVRRGGAAVEKAVSAERGRCCKAISDFYHGHSRMPEFHEAIAAIRDEKETMMPNPMPCPFCGVLPSWESGGCMWWVCKEPLCPGRPKPHCSREDATISWNDQRGIKLAIDAAIERTRQECQIQV